ncbi:hypothetical protein PFISCL1PPCAC_19387, partial [Pristionchus fissidentatus]
GGGGGGGQYMMGSPSPLYGNMDTIRAAQQQQQQRRQLQSIPPHFPSAAPPGAPLGFMTSFAPPPGTSSSDQSSSTPAPPPSFPSATFPPPSSSTPFAPHPSSSSSHQLRVPPGFPTGAANGPPTLQFEDAGGEIDESYADDDDDLSTQVTRAGSVLSIGDETHSQDVSGFHSTVETANNSARLSPVSYSDLPDSPTQCAALRDATLRDQAIQLNLPSFHHPSMPPSGPFSIAPSGGSGSTSSDGLSSSQTHSSHTTPHATSAEQTPTFATMNAQYCPKYDTPRADVPQFAALEASSSAPSTSAGSAVALEAKREEDEDDDYGVYGEDDLLDRSIEEALPRRVEEKRERMESFALDSSSLPPNRSPSSKGNSRYSTSSTLKEEDILAAAIESAMPKVGSLSSPRGTLPKNGVARWSEEGKTTTEGLTKNDGNEEEEESDESDSEYSGGRMSESIVGMMPRDVEEEVEAERIAIDCSSLRRKPRPPRSSHLPRHQSSLTTPTSTRIARQTTPTSGSASSNGRPSPRPLTSTPTQSKAGLNKFRPTPRVSAISVAGTPNGNSNHQRETTPPSGLSSNNGRPTPPSTGSAPIQATPTSTSSLSRLKKPTASAVVPPYNYQSPTTTSRDDRKVNSAKEKKEVDEKKANGQILVTTV